MLAGYQVLQHVTLWNTFHIQTVAGKLLLKSSAFYSVTICHLVNGFLHETFEIWCDSYILIKTKYILIYKNWLGIKVSFSTYYINIITTSHSSKDAGPGDRKDVLSPTQSLTIFISRSLCPFSFTVKWEMTIISKWLSPCNISGWFLSLDVGSQMGVELYNSQVSLYYVVLCTNQWGRAGWVNKWEPYFWVPWY